MKRIILALASALAFQFGTAADTGFLDRTVVRGGQEYRYQVYVPISWSSNQRWPVIVSLHGNGSQGSDGSSHTAQSSLARQIRAERDRFPAIAIFPQARVGMRWSTPAMQEMVLATIDQAITDFSGDVNRVYLTGFSMGGGGVIRMASRWPERFAAIVDVSGRVSIPTTAANITQALLDEDLRTHDFLRSPDPFVAVAGRLRGLPIWVFHGSADDTVPVEESRRLVAALKAARATVRYTEYDGVDHSGAPDRAWADKALTDWLFAQRRTRS